MDLVSFIPKGNVLTAGPYYTYSNGFVEVTLYYRPEGGLPGTSIKRRIDLRFGLIAHGDCEATEAVSYN